MPTKTKMLAVSSEIAAFDTTDKHGLDSLNAIFYTGWASVMDSTEKFIRLHPSSFVSLITLNYYAKGLPLEKVKELYSVLSPSLKHYPSSHEIERKMELYESLKTGKNALDFLIDTGINKKISLKSYAGKYLLIDFWAGWCGPCVAQLPQLREARLKIPESKLSIVTISFDKSSEKWKAALEKHKMSCFTNVFVERGFNDAVSIDYDIRYIPTNFLIDPNGKIIAQTVLPSDLAGYIK